MKRRMGALLVGVVMMAVAGGVAFTAPKAGQPVTVRVLRAKVMKNPSYIGPVAATLSRGEKLEFKEAKGAWYRVEGAASGWIHKSSVVDKAIQLSSKPGGDGGSTSEEVELAGRGFTPQVEDKYRKDNPNLDFSHVDAIENTEIDPESLVEFVNAGGLGGGR